MFPLVGWAATAAAAPVIDALDVEIGDHSVSVPPHNLVPQWPLRPALTLGAQHVWAGQRVQLVQTARLGGHAHPTLGNAVRLVTELDLRWAHRSGLVAEAGLGGGAHLVFRQRPVLTRDPESGTYQAARDGGRPTGVLGAGIALGFDVAKVSDVPLTVLLDAHLWAQTGFLPALSVVPTSTLSLGLRVPLGRSS
ncbi:MAG: hypothetical protein KTR31_20030 [Myxococcales bacterium]|nr:hypothetical protein [Myxococcales bacterium]